MLADALTKALCEVNFDSLTKELMQVPRYNTAIHSLKSQEDPIILWYLRASSSGELFSW
jgi:hypothetical protein